MANGSKKRRVDAAAAVDRALGKLLPISYNLQQLLDLHQASHCQSPTTSSSYQTCIRQATANLLQSPAAARPALGKPLPTSYNLQQLLDLHQASYCQPPTISSSYQTCIRQATANLLQPPAAARLALGKLLPTTYNLQQLLDLHQTSHCQPPTTSRSNQTCIRQATANLLQPPAATRPALGKPLPTSNNLQQLLDLHQASYCQPPTISSSYQTCIRQATANLLQPPAATGPALGKLLPTSYNLQQLLDLHQASHCQPPAAARPALGKLLPTSYNLQQLLDLHQASYCQPPTTSSS